MDYHGFKIEKTNSIGILTFNRPEKLNALTRRTIFVDLPAALDDIRDDNNIRVLLITGSGRGFCSGADIDEMAGANEKTYPGMAQKMQPIGGKFISQLHHLEKPVVAAINGVAGGGGLSILLSADIRIASNTAKFSFAYFNGAMVPGMGATFMLPKIVGLAKAFELVYMGEIIDASEAERIGLVNRVVTASQIMNEAMAISEKLAARPTLTLGQVRRAFHCGLANDFDQQLIVEGYAHNLCMNTLDYQEGVRSFQGKHKPVFKGR